MSATAIAEVSDGDSEREFEDAAGETEACPAEGGSKELNMDTKSLPERYNKFKESVRRFARRNRVSLVVVAVPEWPSGKMWEYGAGPDWSNVGPREALEHVYDVIYNAICPTAKVAKAECRANCPQRCGVKALLQAAVQQGAITQHQADLICQLPFTGFGQEPTGRHAAIQCCHGTLPGGVAATNAYHACRPCGDSRAQLRARLCDQAH
jgi:hypothetical protein